MYNTTFRGIGLVWIGYNDKIKEGNFTWIGLPGTGYNDFGQNEPNNGDGAGEEDCVVQGQHWNDVTCELRVNSVCEKRTSKNYIV